MPPYTIQPLFVFLPQKKPLTIAQKHVSLSNICTSIRNISRLIRKHINRCLFSYILLHQVNKFFQRCTVALPEIKNFVSMRTINRTNNSIHNVGNECIITTTRSVAKLLNFLITTNSINELEWCHVWPSSWTVDSKKS